ncbi:MAG: hypothetical protein ACLFS9_09045 [Nitriliruptoraceae bacterium]
MAAVGHLEDHTVGGAVPAEVDVGEHDRVAFRLAFVQFGVGRG